VVEVVGGGRIGTANVLIRSWIKDGGNGDKVMSTS